MLAGYYHDHLLVPLEQADEAIEALKALARCYRDRMKGYQV